ncbi:MAG: hypothetical protein V3S94_00365 [Gammaproteobacteria bacterium]
MMLYEPPDSAELEELQELNLLFLMYLRAAARAGGDCLGLPARSARTLRELSSTALEALSMFPRSLFLLDLNNLTTTREHLVLLRTALDQSLQALALTVLHSAWNMSRQRDFQARMFLRLSAVATRRLRTVALSELPLLAGTPSLLSCAFPGARSLWATLINRTEAELPRALKLIALHPDAAVHPARHAMPLRSLP